MGFDGDDDWALSDDGWNLILAGGDHVVDDSADDLEALRSGRLGFKDTSMFPAPPFTSAGTTRRSERPSWRRPGPWRRSCVGRTLRAGPARRRRTARLGCRRARHGGDPGGSGVQAELRMEVLSPSRRAQLNDESETPREVSFNDRDFELLFEPRRDEVLEDPGLEAQMGFLNLRFADWLLPFWEDYDPFGSDADDGESA